MSRTSGRSPPLADRRRVDRRLAAAGGGAHAGAGAAAAAAAGAAAASRPAVPRRRRPRVAERHGHRRHGALRHRPGAADDFSVFEDGVKQDVTFFNRTNLPIALALLLDTSASMETKLPTAQEAAIGFARRLRPQDLAEVIDFDSRVVVLQTFTNNAAELEQAIRKTSAGGSTSLYNAVYIALKDLKKVVAKNVDEIRRQAIVVLSDGEDTSSLLPFEEVLDLAKRSETAIYAIGLRADEGAGRRREGLQGSRVRAAAVLAGNRRPRVLPEPVSRSGGRLRPDFRRAVEPVHGRLHVAESASATAPGAASSSASTGRTLTARTKQGYFAPTTPHVTA